jgi:hypothetical protein
VEDVSDGGSPEFFRSPRLRQKSQSREVDMESEVFRYVRVAHSEMGSGYVAIAFERERGNQFDVTLTADDARQLIDDLAMQIRIASQGSE